MTLKRSAAPQRKTPIRRSGKKIRAVNPEREAKRRKRRKANHAKYRASEAYMIVERRSAGQCEASVRYAWGSAGITLMDVRADMAWMAHATHVRCGNNEGLQHHHVRYPKVAGGETPDDVLVCCKRCHGWIERVNYPTRKNGRNYV